MRIFDLKSFKPYLAFLVTYMLISALIGYLVFSSGGHLIDDFPTWARNRFLLTTSYLLPASLIAVYFAMKVGKLSVLGVAVLIGSIHIILQAYNVWMLSQLDIPQPGFLEALRSQSENAYWPYPLWNFLRDISVPALSVAILNHLTSHSSQQPSAAGTPKGAP